MYMIVYMKETGKIIALTQKQDISVLYQSKGQEFVDSLGVIYTDEKLRNLHMYIVVDGELVNKPIEPVEPIEPVPTNAELQARLKELENVIDTMLGGTDNAL